MVLQIDIDEVPRLSLELEPLSPQEILRWAVDRWGERVGISTAFGVGGSILIDMACRDGLPVRVFSLDTRRLFPETRDVWSRFEEAYGITIERYEPLPSEQEIDGEYGRDLTRRDPDRCCFIRKVEPMRRALAHLDCWFSGVRRDQGGGRSRTPVLQMIRVPRDAAAGNGSAFAQDSRAVIKCHPLVRWTKRDVWQYVLDNGVPYHPLLDRGYGSIGCEPCTSVLRPGEEERDGRWRGTDKSECGIHNRVGIES